MVVGAAGTILELDGTSWNEPPITTSARFNSVWGDPDGNLFVAVGTSGAVVVRRTGGWSAHTSGTSETLHRVWGASSSAVFAVGTGGTILFYDGSSWSPQACPTAEPLRGVWGSAATRVFAVGGDGTVLRRDGSSWSEQNTETTKSLFDVWGLTANDVFVVGQSGTLLRRTGVNAWTAERSGTASYLHAVAVTAGGRVLAVGDWGCAPKVVEKAGAASGAGS